MSAIRYVALTVAILPGFAVAADRPLVGEFAGTGRACSGGLFIRSRTIEWNSTYSICRPSRYDVLEHGLDGDRRRIVYRLKQRSSRCRFEVVEVEQASRYNWNVSGYPSFEAFEKRALPDWRNSSRPERQVLSCPMTGPD